MQVLSTKSSLELFEAYIRELLRNLGADGRFASVVPAVRAFCEQFLSIGAAWRAREEALKLASVELQVADRNQDNALETAAHTLLTKTHGSRLHPQWVSHFGHGITEITRAPITEEQQRVLIVAAIFDKDTDPDLKALAAPLRDAAEQTEVKLTAHRQALLAEGIAHGELQLAKWEFNKACRKLWYDLWTLLDYDKREVEKVFPDVTKSKSGPPASPAAPGGTTPASPATPAAS